MCGPFTVFKGTDYDGQEYSYRATHVRRSARLKCRKARNLLKAAYGGGPLPIVKKVYPRGSDGNVWGRPTYWVRGGWRCSNGAGGAACWNATRPRFNVIPIDGAENRLAVEASV